MHEKMKSTAFEEVEKILRSGGVGIFPTDTLYGFVGSALKKATVERIYSLRKREKDKPMIVLISSLKELETFGIYLTMEQEKLLKKYWPGKVSVVLECKKKKWQHLHRGKNSIAFRFSDDKNLLEILKKVGPLVAPSANIAGEKPAESIGQAQAYFGDEVDFYVDCGKLKSKPSTLISLDEKGKIKVLRKGAVRI
jgi:L-threonylcarbamoyladenylate synthase